MWVSWSQGAVLVTKDSYDYVPQPNVAKSTVGAGDSMVGGMTWASSKPLKEVTVGGAVVLPPQ
jgi:6-phosphofructokinase 2